MKFIKDDDVWGIKKAVRVLWNQYNKDTHSMYMSWVNQNKELAFNAFFNQFLPLPYKESKEAVLRHKDEIITILKSGAYKKDYIWVKQPIAGGNSLKCLQLNQSTLARLSQTKEELPTYEEIEAEKNRWQSHPKYKKENGFSTPILEEFVQIKFKRKGGDLSV